MTYLYLNINTA